MSILVASAVLLRWTSAYGPAIAVIAALLIVLAGGILFSQHRRYHSSSLGLARQNLTANVTSVVLVTCAMLLFGGAAITFVLLDSP